MFSFTQLSEDAGLFAQFFKTSDSALNGFVFSDSNSGHKMHSPPINMDHILSAGKCKLFHSQVKQFAFKIDGLEPIDRFYMEI